MCACLTVGFMIVPQSMIYTKLAGLPVEYALYSALLTGWIYTSFGSSQQFTMGSGAYSSLILSTVLTVITSKEEVTKGERQTCLINCSCY